MIKTHNSTRFTLVHAAWIALAALALFARLLPGERTIDDAFITYRYVENVVAGRGFVYNPGERVQGTTTPLYTLLLSAQKLFLPGARLPALSRATNALAGALSVLVLAWMGARVLGLPGLGLAVGLLWAVSPMAVTFAIGGMETPVYVLLLLSALATYAAGWSRWSAVFCALATLTRPDALLLVGPLFLHMAWKRRRIPWREAGLYLAILLPWVAFATLYFGSPLAHSVVAKSDAYRLESTSALGRLIQHYATPFFGHLVFGTRWVGVGIFLYPALAAVGALGLVRGRPPLRPPRTDHGGEDARSLSPPRTDHGGEDGRSLSLPRTDHGGEDGRSLNPAPTNGRLRGEEAERDAAARLWPLALYPLFYFVALSAYNPLIFRWYLAPIIPMYVLCILAGGHRLFCDLAALAEKKWPAAQRWRGGVEVALVLVLAGMLVNGWQLHPDHGPDRPAPAMAWFKLEQLYRQATRDLVAREPISAQTRIAAGDIGAIGYESGARILDTVGLVSPEALGYAPPPDEAYVIAYAISTDLILDQQPEYLIALEVYLRRTLLQSEVFLEQYELWKRWPTDIYGSEGLLIYRRR